MQLTKKEEKELRSYLSEKCTDYKLRKLIDRTPKYLKIINKDMDWAIEWECKFSRTYKCIDGRYFKLSWLILLGEKKPVGITFTEVKEN
jgi:hypothetical protein|nr:MAG TPA: hypothetical protein [Caudoviricetes sp.]